MDPPSMIAKQFAEQGEERSVRPFKLQFVTYTSASGPGTSRESQTTVRSHVTRRRHYQKRYGDPFRPTKNEARSKQSGSSSAAAFKAGGPPAHNAPSAALSRSEATSATEDSNHEADDRSLLSSITSLSTPSSLGSTQEDPFWTLPVDYSPLFPPIIAHYIQNLALPVVDLDGPSQKGLLRTHWFPMAMMSPATMYSLLLMGACHYYRVTIPEFGEDPSLVVRPQVIFTLKARVLEEVNRCLRSDDVHVAVGDTTIGAVAKLAAFEAVFGDEDAYRQHMVGLRRMLQVRRAVGSALGPLNSFLTRLVTWIDVNAAHFTGRPNQKLLDLGIEIKEPDPLLFAGTTQCRSQIQLLDDG